MSTSLGDGRWLASQPLIEVARFGLDWLIATIPFPIAISILLSICAYLATFVLIPICAPIFAAKGRVGKDLLKADLPPVPESIGALVGTVYFVFLFLFIPISFLEAMQSPNRRLDFPHDRFAQFLGGLLALFSMLFLGFADEVLDIRWRVKIWFPLIASLPLLMVYMVTYGKTDILIPVPLQCLVPDNFRIIHLGSLYYVYMAALVVFSTNGINILAGVNGIEGAQALVIACSIALNDVFQLNLNPYRKDAHLTSLYFLLPFIGVCTAYLQHNWYPAKVFGGDSFCYFAGMIFAVVGILGNFSKTVLLFMIPQIFNFVISTPQLFGLVKCPRHRMPKLNKVSGLLEPSVFVFERGDTSLVGWLIIWTFSTLCWVKVEPVSSTTGDVDAAGKETGQGNPQTTRLRKRTLSKENSSKNSQMMDRTKSPTTKNVVYTCTNFTIINVLLVIFGPMAEWRLASCVLLVQVFGSLFAFTCRYLLVHLLY